MDRTTGVTVGVVAGSSRNETRRFLDGLAATLGPHDNVVLLGPGRAPSTEAVAWRLPGSRGALRPAAGTLPRPRPVIVFVDERVELTERWLDQLVAALADPAVAAVAPRTNWADGDELFVGVPYRPSEGALRRRFARGLAAEAPGLRSPVQVLAGPCLAVRREALERLGGLAGAMAGGYDPVRLATAARAAGGELVVAEGCYLHHPGGERRWPDPATFGRPLVSACLIVKDEEANLPRCLASLRPLADEVVVYDTGSSDATVALAEAAGAKVVLGYWDDDFARARNDALAHCRGQWVLWLDADEELVCEDPAGLRSGLAELPTALEGYVLLIDNLNGNEAALTFTHPACRLFRRAYGHWQGHLHELVVARAGSAELARQLFEGARIAHRGYLQSFIAGREKGQRNLRTAFGDLAGGSDLEWAFRLTSLGRSYTVVGQFPEAIEHCRRAAAVATVPSTARLALRTVVECLLALGKPDEALTELERIRRLPGSERLVDLLEGRIHAARGEHELALACFGRVGHGVDDDGFEYSPAMVAVPRAEILRALGREHEAADVLLASLVESGGVDAHLGTAIELLEAAGRDLGELHDALGPERIGPFVPQLLQLQPGVADRALEAWYGRDPGARRLLAAAVHVARRLEIPRQLVWSARLRDAGLPSACPLVSSGADPGVPVRDRLLAAASAAALFGDLRALQAFGAAAAAVPEGERAALGAESAALAPLLARRFELLAAPERSILAPQPRAPSPPGGGRRVLLLDRELAGLRSAALALALRRAGHDVTLLQPLPADSTSDLLGAHGVAVRGWEAGSPEPSAWRPACERALAWLTAEEPFDVALVRPSALEALPALRRLLPLAALVVDGDGADPSWRPDQEVDLLLDPAFEPPPGARAAPAQAALGDVLAGRAGIPLEARAGLVVAGGLRPASPEQLARLTATAQLLHGACEGSSLAFCGDDPDRALVASLPGALLPGPLADPTPWVASARLLVAVGPRDAEQWLEVAALCGTPALVLPEDPARDGELAAAVRALLGDDGIWQRVAAEAPAAPRAPGTAADPLALAPRRPAPTRRPGQAVPEVRIVGGVYRLESLAQMNRELATHLVAARPGFEVSVLTREPEPYPPDSVRALAPVRVLRSAAAPADLEIRHQWPPDFRPPAGGRLVIMQPWEFGGLPAEWIAPLRDVACELWVPTSWQRQCALRSGLAEGRVQVVPYGVDVARFSPEGPPYPLRTEKSTKLLFVGGLIARKGIDVLLEAYLSTFRASDDVCLVVKPFGAQSVYRGSTLEREVRQAATGNGPEIELVDGDLGFAEMAALFRSCDALVHPYRGEGFGMPIAEAMASGLPVVVPDGGACRDFCDEDNAWLVEAREVPIVSAEWSPSAAGSWWLEPSRDALAAAVHALVADPDAAKAKGAAGRQRILDSFTWEAVAERAAARVQALLA